MTVQSADWSLFYPFENPSSAAPDSVCSRPCGPRLYYQQRELECCWDCLGCRNNERLNVNSTGCVPCSVFTWPDDETATRCILIDPEYVNQLL